jgi:hypothetical protein
MVVGLAAARRANALSDMFMMVEESGESSANGFKSGNRKLCSRDVRCTSRRYMLYVHAVHVISTSLPNYSHPLTL